MDCFPTLELTIEAATTSALSMNTFSTVTTVPRREREEQPFNFKWSILSFVFSGSAILACKWLWTWLEGNHLTYLSERFLKSRSDPEKREQMATDIVTYINDSQTAQHMMAVYVMANIFTLSTMVGLMYWYFDTVDYFHNPFSPAEFYNWTITQAEERTDVMIKLFPRICVFKYHSTGPSGTVQYADIFCTAGINTTLEYIYAATLIVIPIVCLVHFVSVVLSVTTVALFHKTTDKDNKQIKGIKDLTYGQRLIYSLVSKNIDDNLWYAVLSKIGVNTSKIQMAGAKQLSEKDQHQKDLLQQCPKVKLQNEKRKKVRRSKPTKNARMAKVQINRRAKVEQLDEDFDGHLPKIKGFRDMKMNEIGTSPLPPNINTHKVMIDEDAKKEWDALDEIQVLPNV